MSSWYRNRTDLPGLYQEKSLKSSFLSPLWLLLCFIIPSVFSVLVVKFRRVNWDKQLSTCYSGTEVVLGNSTRPQWPFCCLQMRLDNIPFLIETGCALRPG